MMKASLSSATTAPPEVADELGELRIVEEEGEAEGVIEEEGAWVRECDMMARRC